MPHLIRLAGPWHYQGSAGSKSPRPRQTSLPCDLRQLAQSSGENCLLLSRRFHRPTGLADSDRVLLLVQQPAALEKATLNGQPLTRLSAEQQSAEQHSIEKLVARFDLTEHLLPYNHLELTVCLPDSQSGSSIGPVQLEIL